MSRQRNRHKKRKQDNKENLAAPNEQKNEQPKNNHVVKSVVSTNVTKHTHNQNNQAKKSDNSNNRPENQNDPSRRNKNNEQSGRRRKKKKKNKNKNSKLRNIRPEDLFQLKDPKRQKMLKNKRHRPRNFVPYKIERLESTVCPICSKQIDDMCDTILDTQTNQQAHFECVYDRLSKSLKLQEGQRLAYIGSGTFAVIQDVPADDGKNRFVIKEKIEKA